MNKPRYATWAGIATLALALGLTAFGCAGVYVDPGPNPAKIVLDLSTSVTPAAANRALEMRGYIDDRVESWDKTMLNLSGPYWDYSIQQKNADGSLTDLRHLEKGRIRMIQGAELNKKITFLAPPGPGQYLLLVSCYVVKEDGTAWDWMSITVDVGGLKENLGLTLKPGETKVVRRRVDVK